MTISYDILATVTLLHDYYADKRCADFTLVPSAETAAALKGLSILTRTIGNTLILLVQVADDESTYLDLPNDLKLRFYLELENPGFMNYTHIDFQNKTLFYLSNRYHNKTEDLLYLNQPLPAFSNGTAYEIGDLILAGGEVYEAIKPVAAGSHAVTDAAFWYHRQGRSYVHTEDRLPLCDGVFQTAVAAATSFDIKVFAQNAATSDFDVLVREKVQSFEAPVTELTIDLTDLTPGKYRLVVNGTERFLYVDTAAAYARVFGVVELSNLFPPADDFGWRDATGKSKKLNYNIRFANRLAIWKYITSTNVTLIENTAVPGQFEAIASAQFVSTAPLPMQQTAIKTLQAKKGTTLLASRLANPPPDRIATYTDTDHNTWYCAEMYLNL